MIRDRKEQINRAREQDAELRARHPLLKLGSKHYEVYNFLRKHPGATRAYIRQETGAHPQVISDLANEGIIIGRGAKYSKHSKYEIAPEGGIAVKRRSFRCTTKLYADAQGRMYLQVLVPDDIRLMTTTSSPEDNGLVLVGKKLLSIIFKTTIDPEKAHVIDPTLERVEDSLTVDT